MIQIEIDKKNLKYAYENKDFYMQEKQSESENDENISDKVLLKILFENLKEAC